MIVSQEPAQSLAAGNRTVTADMRTPRKQQDVALPLVIPLSMIMFDVFAQGPPQRALAEEDHLGQDLPFIADLDPAGGD